MLKENIDIKRVQNVLLDMAKNIAGILESHDIPYMIAYGTLLGAVRHGGFIPWDDDFDVYLFEDSYDRAIEVLRVELSEDFFLEDEKSEPLYFHSWAHIKHLKSETSCGSYPQDGCYTHKGICVDLYRTRKLYKGDLENFLVQENRSYIERRRKKSLISNEEYEERMKRLRINEESNLETDPTESKKYVYDLVPLYKCHCMRAEDVLPLKKYSFEDAEFWGPHNADGILTDIYGEYMELPPIEKRKCHYTSVSFDRR